MSEKGKNKKSLEGGRRGRGGRKELLGDRGVKLSRFSPAIESTNFLTATREANLVFFYGELVFTFAGTVTGRD